MHVIELLVIGFDASDAIFLRKCQMHFFTNKLLYFNALHD
jgi:hypothetical protein